MKKSFSIADSFSPPLERIRVINSRRIKNCMHLLFVWLCIRCCKSYIIPPAYSNIACQARLFANRAFCLTTVTKVRVTAKTKHQGKSAITCRQGEAPFFEYSVKSIAQLYSPLASGICFAAMFCLHRAVLLHGDVRLAPSGIATQVYGRIEYHCRRAIISLFEKQRYTKGGTVFSTIPLFLFALT